MRILYILNSLGVGGAERLTITLARRMAERGHTVAVLVLKAQHAGDLSCPVEAVYCGIGGEPVGAFAGAAKALHFLHRFRPDVVHSHSFHSNVFARMLGLSGSAPVISTVHNVYEGGWLRILAYRATGRCCRLTVAVSDAVAERFVQMGAVAPGKFSIVRNAIELEDFAPNMAARAKTRADLGLTQEFAWLTVGRDAPAKDYLTLLRAFERLRAACAHARLLIAGAAFPEQEPLRSVALRVGGSVRWLGMRTDVSRLLDAADGFVMSSAWEGMPLAIAEAMAMEKPVVATDVGGVGELIGYAGSLVPPRDPEKLAEAMISTVGLTAEARGELGSAARRRIKEEFSMAARVEEWERLYARAARAHK